MTNNLTPETTTYKVRSTTFYGNPMFCIVKPNGKDYTTHGRKSLFATVEDAETCIVNRIGGEVAR